jgi:hypothetical protein
MPLSLGSVQAGGAGASGLNAVHTYSFNNVAGDILIVDVMTVSIVAGDKVTGVTYNGVAMTRIADSGDSGAGSHERVFSYYLVGPATGTHNVVVTTTNALYETVNGNATSYIGAKQTGQPDSYAVSVSSSASSPLTISTTVVATGCWLHAFFASYNLIPSAGTGTTSRATFTSGGNGMSADSNGTVGTGSQSQQFTWSGTNAYAAIVLSIAPVPASGPANVKTFDGIATASVKTINGVAIASVKSKNGVI